VTPLGSNGGHDFGQSRRRQVSNTVRRKLTLGQKINMYVYDIFS
jgi:hypothetical protein